MSNNDNNNNNNNNRIPSGLIIGSKLFDRTIEIPPEVASKDIWLLAVKYQFWYSICGLASGFLCQILGMGLFMRGFTEGGHWAAEFFGMRISDAAPGALLFLVGLGIIQLTTFTVRVAKTNLPTTPPTEQ